MRTRASMGKMVNKLTKREQLESFALIERIARGVSHPYMREFTPKVVATNSEISQIAVAKTSHIRESSFCLKEQTSENVVVMRTNAQDVQISRKSDIVFPTAFYEYFEVNDKRSSKAG